MTDIRDEMAKLAGRVDALSSGMAMIRKILDDMKEANESMDGLKYVSPIKQILDSLDLREVNISIVCRE